LDHPEAFEMQISNNLRKYASIIRVCGDTFFGSLAQLMQTRKLFHIGFNFVWTAFSVILMSSAGLVLRCFSKRVKSAQWFGLIEPRPVRMSLILQPHLRGVAGPGHAPFK
jgi:hypothetical protein